MINFWKKILSDKEVLLLADLSPSAAELLKHLVLDEDDQKKLNLIHNEHRKKEFLGSRFLLKEHYGEAIKLDHQPGGKPFLVGQREQISISHSGNLIAILLSKHKTPGIDLEKKNRPISRIIPKFLNDQEQAFLLPEHENEHAIICWTIKEVVVKKLNNKQIDFRSEITIDPFQPDSTGETTVRILTNGKPSKLLVKFFSHREFIISYSI